MDGSDLGLWGVPLMLARLPGEPALSWVDQAVGCARSVGPQLEALARFWGACALLQRQAPEAAAWFAQPTSGCVTGQVLRVCGQSLLGA